MSSDRQTQSREVSMGTTTRHAALLLLAAALPSAHAYVLGPLPAVAPCRAAIARAAPVAAAPGEAQERPAWLRVLRRGWTSAVTTVAICGASVMVGRGGALDPLPAVASTKAGVVKKQPKGGSGVLPTLGLAGGFIYYSWANARAEDEEETVRIKDETEKMERMSKEFTDIDEGVTVDEDIMSSLRKRMGNSTTTNATDASADDSAPGGGGGGSPPPPPPAPVADSGGGAAVLEPPSEGAGAEPEEEAGPSAEDIARLNRLMGLPDAEK